MICEELVEVDGSGFQNGFHIVQNEGGILVFSQF